MEKSKDLTTQNILALVKVAITTSAKGIMSYIGVQSMLVATKHRGRSSNSNDRYLTVYFTIMHD